MRGGEPVRSKGITALDPRLNGTFQKKKLAVIRNGHLPWFVMRTLKNGDTLFSMVEAMSPTWACAFKRVRSARHANMASVSDVTTAATVPNAPSAMKVCWYAVKNSSISLPPLATYRRDSWRRRVQRGV